MSSGAWISLFSGGKDSSWALYRALASDLSVERLVTVHPTGDSYMYHVPATRLTSLAAESIGLPIVDVDPEPFYADAAVDASRQGDAELAPLEAALTELAETLDGGIEGVVAGAVESEYQTSRLEAMADRLGVGLFAPLWQRDPETVLEEMLDAGFDIRIVSVAARGLDESWLGRRIDDDAVADLRALAERYGVHVLGEGGEFETLVVDAPHMDRRIELDYQAEWDGTRGSIVVDDAWLA